MTECSGAAAVEFAEYPNISQRLILTAMMADASGVTGTMCHAQDFEAVKARTSIVPFQAIWEGRQKLPCDYYKEFIRVPYLAVLCTALGAYWAHALMQRASYWLGW